MADAIRPEMYATLIRFAAYTGLRAGEIGALRLGRLDLLRARSSGHSSITVTYNTYGHLFPERDAEITDRLEDLFRRAGVDSSWTRPGARASVSTLK